MSDQPIAPPMFLSTPEVARKLGKPLHVVKYAIDRYSVEPTNRIGNVKLWDADGVARVQYAVKRVASAGPLR